MAYINITKFVVINQLEKDHSMIETPRLKNVVIFIQIILLLFSYRKILQKNQQTTLEVYTIMPK